MNGDLPINEIFDTIQGEAAFTGTPSTFVRLQGCDVGCPWCDTKHTWPLDPRNDRPIDEVLAKTKDSPTFTMASSESLAHYLFAKHKLGHIVITGGEPCNYDLTELTSRLREKRSVQIETSGTREVLVHENTWVTVSPKIDMPGGFKVLDSALERSSEIKMPVGKQADIDLLHTILARTPKKFTRTIWLQPLSQSEKATALCVRAASEHGWRISIQTHKYLGVR